MGSLQFVHQECLKKWLKAKINSGVRETHKIQNILLRCFCQIYLSANSPILMELEEGEVFKFTQRTHLTHGLITMVVFFYSTSILSQVTVDTEVFDEATGM